MSRNSRRERSNLATVRRRKYFGTPLAARRSLFEEFEDRRVLDGYFSTLANDVAGPNSASGGISTALQHVDTLTKLPLIGSSLSGITEVTNVFSSFQTQLYSTLNSLSPSESQTDVQTAIFDA